VEDVGEIKIMMWIAFNKDTAEVIGKYYSKKLLSRQISTA